MRWTSGGGTIGFRMSCTRDSGGGGGIADIIFPTLQKITQQIGVKAFVATSARWKGEKRRVCHFFIRRLSQPRGRSAIMAVQSVGGSPACLSNLVQGAEINSMLFLPPPLPTQTLGILLSLPLSFSRRAAAVCSQHVANRVNDVDACRKSHSESVGIASGRRVSRTMTDFFLVSRPESVGRPFSPNIIEATELAPLLQYRALLLCKGVRSSA